MELKIKFITFLLLTICSSLFVHAQQDLLDKGEEAFVNKDYETARKYFKEAVDKYPNSAQANHDYGYTVAVLGDIETGLKYVEKALKIAPNETSWYIERGELRYYSGDRNGAMDDFLYYEMNSDEPEKIYAYLAQLYHGISNFEKMNTYLEKYKKSIQNPDEILPNYHYLKAEYHIENQEYFKAIQEATKAINKSESWFEPYFTRALAYYNSGRYKQSVEDYTKYIEGTGGTAVAFSNCGLAKEKINDLEGALKDYEQALKLNSNDNYTFINRSEVYRKKKDYQNALNDLDKAIQIDPKFPLAYNKKAIIYADMNNAAKAVENFTKAIQLNPNVLDYTGRSTAYLKLGKDQEAYNDSKKILELDSGNSNGYLNGGTALSNLKRYNEAIKLVTEGIQKNPDDGMLYYLRSGIYNLMGEKEKSAKDDKKAKSLLTQ